MHCKDVLIIFNALAHNRIVGVYTSFRNAAEKGLLFRWQQKVKSSSFISSLIFSQGLS